MLACTYEANLGRSADTLWNMYNRTESSRLCSRWPSRAGKDPSACQWTVADSTIMIRLNYNTLKGTHLLVISLERPLELERE